MLILFSSFLTLQGKMKTEKVWNMFYDQPEKLHERRNVENKICFGKKGHVSKRPENMVKMQQDVLSTEETCM